MPFADRSLLFCLVYHYPRNDGCGCRDSGLIQLYQIAAFALPEQHIFSILGSVASVSRWLPSAPFGCCKCAYLGMKWSFQGLMAAVGDNQSQTGSEQFVALRDLRSQGASERWQGFRQT